MDPGIKIWPSPQRIRSSRDILMDTQSPTHTWVHNTPNVLKNRDPWIQFGKKYRESTEVFLMGRREWKTDGSVEIMEWEEERKAHIYGGIATERVFFFFSKTSRKLTLAGFFFFFLLMRTLKSWYPGCLLGTWSAVLVSMDPATMASWYMLRACHVWLIWTGPVPNATSSWCSTKPSCSCRLQNSMANGSLFRQSRTDFT